VSDLTNERVRKKEREREREKKRETERERERRCYLSPGPRSAAAAPLDHISQHRMVTTMSLR